MAKQGRPKGPKRVRMSLHVLPTTDKAIRALVRREDGNKDTHGKIVDDKFKD